MHARVCLDMCNMNLSGGLKYHLLGFLPKPKFQHFMRQYLKIKVLGFGSECNWGALYEITK